MAASGEGATPVIVGAVLADVKKRLVSPAVGGRSAAPYERRRGIRIERTVETRLSESCHGPK